MSILEFAVHISRVVERRRMMYQQYFLGLSQLLKEPLQKFVVILFLRKKAHSLGIAVNKSVILCMHNVNQFSAYLS